MDEDAPVLMGRLRVAWNNNATVPSYSPPVSLFPELLNCSVPASAPFSIQSVDGLNREASSWDVATLINFRGGRSGTNPPPQDASSSTSGKRNAREALAALVASGKLPGVTSTKSIPSTLDIVKALDKFALDVGASDEDCAALRSQHFLHLLGYQRLAQLSSNLQAFGVSASSSATSVGGSAVPCEMFSSSSTSTPAAAGDAKWVTTRTKLYDTLLQLVNDEEEQKNRKSAATASSSSASASCVLWASPPEKVSEGCQTASVVDPTVAGTINESIATDGSVKHKAEELIPFTAPKELLPVDSSSNTSSSSPSAATTTLRVRVVKQQQSTGDDDNNNNVEGFVDVPLRADRVCFGRRIVAGSTRSREEASTDDKEGAAAEEQKEEDASTSSSSPPAEAEAAATELSSEIDPWHVDLAAIVRNLTKRRVTGSNISRLSFVLQRRQLTRSSSTSQQNKNNNNNNNKSTAKRQLELLPCGKNFLRVNHDVVYAAPRVVGKGDVIRIGSGNNEEAVVEIAVL